MLPIIGELLRLMQSDRLIVKTFHKRECFHFFEKLLNPETIRGTSHPTHPIYDQSGRIPYHPGHTSTEDLTRRVEMPVFNPRTQQFELKMRNYVRGAPKPEGYAYTKKTSVTLLPRNGKIILFQEDTNHMGLFCDLTQVLMKDEKYIFLFDASTVNKWWLNYSAAHPTPMLETLVRPGHPEIKPLFPGQGYFKSYTLEQLTHIINHFELFIVLFDQYRLFYPNPPETLWLHALRERMIKTQSIWFNELLVGVSVSSVLSLFYTNDVAYADTIEVRDSLKARYSLSLPIVKYSPELGRIVS